MASIVPPQVSGGSHAAFCAVDFTRVGLLEQNGRADGQVWPLPRPGTVVEITTNIPPRSRRVGGYLGEVHASGRRTLTIRVWAEQRKGRWRSTKRPAPLVGIPWPHVRTLRLWFDKGGWRNTPAWRAIGAPQPTAADPTAVAARLEGVSTARLLAIALPLLKSRQACPSFRVRNMAFHALGVEVDDVLAEVRRRQAIEQALAGRPGA